MGPGTARLREGGHDTGGNHPKRLTTTAYGTTGGLP
jgi:hypothetical protein